MKLTWASALGALVSLEAVLSAGIPSEVGNCLTKRHYFNETNRIAAPASSGQDRHSVPIYLDYTKYDWTIDYAKEHVTFGANGGVMLSLMPPDKSKGILQGAGSKLSSTRYMRYGKVTARLKSISTTPGVVTTFITMSDIGDELDFEILGLRPTAPETNVFYHQFEHLPPWNLPLVNQPSGVRSVPISISGDGGDYHIYSIEIKDTEIDFYVDQQLRRSYAKKDQADPTAPGGFWFPDTPALVQVSVWDATQVSQGVAEWAGSSINWGIADPQHGFYAIYEYIDIQCYDDKMQPVAKWPLDTLDNDPQGGLGVDVPMDSDGQVQGVPSNIGVANANMTGDTTVKKSLDSPFKDPSRINRVASPAGLSMTSVYGPLLAVVAAAVSSILLQRI
ncbi:concanavalin A-like lectin/glucanase domain-containing protein [Polychytrium aggregatum]|uniref:concanavalin A-like lectin/glucanase domain-containing protein n=1 Tax=Polychytrium aggregatum TaxID=110093 RepID=UPI0022FDB4D4|nr:concanavalin A-like lectin/glucanase domain-containing protein [Polychytrium aggregatum]KAI9199532.1 concanavalin A-like lectin/glucanase domain-containing protein [Polychytrium aggregatum]